MWEGDRKQEICNQLSNSINKITETEYWLCKDPAVIRPWALI